MPEDVLFESESDQSREDIAAYLRQVAQKLERGEAITLTAGAESVTMEPPGRPTFEVKAEREGPTDGVGEVTDPTLLRSPTKGFARRGWGFDVGLAVSCRRGGRSFLARTEATFGVGVPTIRGLGYCGP